MRKAPLGTLYITDYTSPIGRLTLAADGDNLIGLWIEGQKHFGGDFESKGVQRDDLEVFQVTSGWLDSYFAGRQPAISELRLAPKGSEFRKVVWQVLQEIPYGETMTYGEIAKLVGKRLGREKMSARAVGGAVGHNPISIIVPCHRVVGANGKLTGYAGGNNTKEFLLRHERAMID